MKAPFCKQCETEHYSTQPHGGQFAPRTRPDINKVAAKAATAGKKKAKRK